MSRLQLTAPQKKAVATHDKNVSISAGAGSGKTRVLVERFCEIVRLGKADADNILTVTFTEKAAKEMKQRIVERFDDLHKAEPNAHFAEQRRKVESAYIGTIHSFASRLLRENSFDAGLDPRFIVLTNAQAKTLKLQVLEDLIATNYIRGKPEYAELLSSLEEKSTTSETRDNESMGSGRSKGLSGAVMDLYEHACSLGLHVAEVGTASTNPDLCAITDRYVAAGQDLIQLATGTEAARKKVGEFRPTYAFLSVEMRKQSDRLLDLGPDGYAAQFDWAVYDEIRRAAAFSFGNTGGTGLKHLRDDLKESAQAYLRAVLSPVARRIIAQLVAIGQDFEQEYEAAKYRVGALDFNDMLLITKRLLISPDGSPTTIAERCRKKFKFVVMDEFQDSNSLQKSIIESVCQPAGNGQCGNFFTVGDVKQSIYGFINSDVSVFLDHHGVIGKTDPEAALSFQDNFRSHPKVIGFVNWFFEGLWRDDGFEFEPLTARGGFHPLDNAGVEVMLIPDARSADEGRLAEARAIADRINELLGRNGHEPFMVSRIKKDDTPPRSLELKDIMILFRSTKQCAIYERALRERGIDYYVVGGGGFYKTHEVQDILNLLRIIDNPLNDVAMAAVLRSPMVAISEDALWWLTRKHKPLEQSEDDEGDGSDIPLRNRDIGKLYSALTDLESVRSLGSDDRARLEAFDATLARVHAMRSETDITALIDIVLDATRYDLKVLASQDGKRRYANIGKLMEIAIDFQSNGIFTLADFIRRVEELSTLDDRQEEAQTETEDSQVVRLMTIHQAKGLEAPVVFLANCSAQMNVGKSDAFIMDRTAGIACKVRNPMTGTWEETDAYSVVKESLKEKDLQEEKRVLYVAATRAEELLVLCDYKGAPAPRLHHTLKFQSESTWSGWMERLLEISEPPESTNTLAAGEDCSVALNLVSLAEWTPRSTLETAATRHAEKIIAGMPIPTTGDFDASEVVGRCLDDCPTCANAPMSLTVSGVLDYIACPKRYYRRWILGIDDIVDPSVESVIDKAESSSAELGLAVHAILSEIDFAADIEAQLDMAAERLDRSIRKRAIALCQNFLGSDWFHRVSNSVQVMRETPFTVCLADFTLSGRIDLLFKDTPGWVVLDYKTGGREPDSRYDQQVGLYALAVEKCLGVTPDEVILLNLGSEEHHSRRVDDELISQAHASLTEVAARIRKLRQDRQPEGGCGTCTACCSEF